jgi:hypothetical protein
VPDEHQRRRDRPGSSPVPDRDRVRVRGSAYQRSSESSPLAPRPAPVRSRRAGSQVSFGLGGRLACTALLALPTVGFIVSGTLFWMFLAFASWIVAAVALPDIWRAVDVAAGSPDRDRRDRFTI